MQIVLTSRNLTNALLTSVLLMAVQSAEALNRFVDGNNGIDGGNDCDTAASPCLTIGQAVSSSDAGDVIQIDDAVYTEILTIPVSLTLQGESRTGTVIQAAAQPGQAADRVLTVTNSSDLVLSDVSILNGNRLTGSGGAIRIEDGNLTATRVTFRDNRIDSEAGGAVFAQDNVVVMTDVEFIDNAIGDSAGVESGGGLYVRRGDLSLENVRFSGNSAADDGGGLWMRDTTAVMTDVQFLDNVADRQGGAVFIRDSSPAMTRVVVSGNQAGQDGGGIFALFDSAPQLTNVLISGNKAIGFGGGIAFQRSSSTLTRLFTNVTITGNDAGSRGGGIFKPGNVELRNTIIWNNRDQSGTVTQDASMSDFFTSSIEVNDSLVQGFGANELPGTGALDGTTGANNPMFRDPVDPSGLSSLAGNLRLQQDSPVRDRGNNSFVAGIDTDLDGEARIFGGTVDLGPYEGTDLIFADGFEGSEF